MSNGSEHQHTSSGDASKAIDVLKVAKLARLHVAPGEVDETRAKLAVVVTYMDRLRTLDLSGVEPLAHVGDAGGNGNGGTRANRLDEDVAKPETLCGVLPMLSKHLYEGSGQVFVRVPKVIGDGGGLTSGGGA